MLKKRTISVISLLPSAILASPSVISTFPFCHSRSPFRHSRLSPCHSRSPFRHSCESRNPDPLSSSAVIPAKAGIQSAKFQAGFTSSDTTTGQKNIFPRSSGSLGQNKPQRNFRHQAGFTLIEVAVVSAIMIFLMASVWSGSSIRESDFSVMISQEKLRLLATRAKSLTVNSVFGADDPACGYGIRIEEKSAFIFLDRGGCDSNNPSNQRFDHGERLPGSTDTIVLTGGMIFQPSIEGNVVMPVDIVFIPPYSGTVINSDPDITEMNIKVSSLTGISRNIIISNQGLINARN